MTATPARDSDSEMEEMPLRERMAKFDEELAEHRGLVERLAPGPPKVIAPLTVAEAFDLLDAAKAKDQKQKKAHQAEDKAKEKEMPPWWRLNEDYFRELRVRDLARVVPPRGWLAETDPDLLVPPRGRPASREGGPDEATWWRDAPSAQGGVGVDPQPVPNAAPGASCASMEKVTTTTGVSVAAPPTPLVFAPYVAPKPSGPAVGHDLLDAELRADELAALARGVLLFSERREKDVKTLAKEFCARDERHVEDWLAGVGRCKRREDGDDVCKGVARWLRHRAATAQIDAAKERRDATEPLDIYRAEAQNITRPDGGGGDGVPASPYQPPPPTVVAVIKTNDDGTVYVGGEEPAKAAAAAAGGGGNAGATGVLGGVITGAAAVAARALGLGGRTASTMSASSAAVNGGSLSALPSSAAIAASDGGSDAANQRAEPATEEERAEAEHRRLVQRAFGHQGSLPHLHGPCQTDEAMPPHTAMLLDRCFWLASSVSKLPKAPPPTPWISPSPPKLREVVSSRASRQGDKKGAPPGGRNGRGDASAGGRCAVCVVQKKGRCGTDTAPRNCLRRAGAGRFKRDDDDDDDEEEEPDPFDASPEVKAEQRPPAKGAEENAEENAPVLPKPRPKWRTPPAASTAAIAAMRKEERRRRREEAKARRAARVGTDDGMASHTESDSDESSDSDSSSDSDASDARSAQSELDALTRALDSRPELRAAAPCDEVESETLALQYELLWQQQANRAVLSAVLKRVASACEEEGETFARVEGDVAEAAQMMSKVREVRRMVKREKREADQRAALERAAAAAAASSRVGAQRRDADGNVIAPVMGALDGLPPDVVAAALGRAEEEATRRAARERERREAAENAALAAKLAKKAAESYRPPPPMTGRFGQPVTHQPATQQTGNAPAASVSARSATPETPVAAAGGAGGTLGTLGTLGTAHSTPPASVSAAPATLVDTVHAAAEAGAAKKAGECAVCAGTADAAHARETMRCARCALPVHPWCYGSTPGSNEGWMCWCCKDATAKGKANTPAVLAAARTAPPGSIRPSSQEKMAMYRGVSCILCPVQLGAFKQTDDGRWCHVVCAQWQPEVCVKDADEMRCFEGIAQIPKERATQPCVACGQTAGVTMRCSYGHCQATFHPLCARQSGFHVRASDGSKPQFRAYCDKHSPTQRERDDARGVPPAVVPPPPELGPVTVTSLPVTSLPVTTSLQAGGQAMNVPRGGSPSPGPNGEEGSAIRRLRSDLQRARAAGLAPGGRNGGKRKGGVGGGRNGGGFDDSGTASDAEPGSSVIGPSGVVPTAPKRARTGSAKQLKSAAAAAAAARAGVGSGVGSEAPGNGREGEFGKSATTTTTTTTTQPKKRGRPRKVQPEGDGVASKEPGAGGAN